MQHKFFCLGGFYGVPKILIAGIFISPKQIFPNGSFKQNGLLHDHADFIPKLRKRVFSHIPAVHLYGAFFHVIKTGNQIDQRGLSGAGAADYADGGSLFGLKMNIGQSLLSAFIVTQAYMVKFHRSLLRFRGGTTALCFEGRSIGRCGGGFHSGRNLENILYPVSTGKGFGHGDDQICQLHKLHQDLGHIVDKSHHLPLGEDTRFYLQGACIDQDDQSAVDHHISKRVHKGGDSTGHLL